LCGGLVLEAENPGKPILLVHGTVPIRYNPNS
jgi:hypothetical protein